MTNNKITGAVGAPYSLSLTQGPQGAMGPTGFPTSSYGSNGPPGPVALSISQSKSTAITIASQSKEVLRITASGEVIWSGKPSEASESLKNLLGNLIDENVKPSMRQRTYIRACKSILAKAKRMEKDELIAFLEKSIQNRQSKEMILLLEEK